jgi:hypothetical protein
MSSPPDLSAVNTASDRTILPQGCAHTRWYCCHTTLENAAVDCRARRTVVPPKFKRFIEAGQGQEVMALIAGVPDSPTRPDWVVQVMRVNYNNGEDLPSTHRYHFTEHNSTFHEISRRTWNSLDGMYLTYRYQVECRFDRTRHYFNVWERLDGINESVVRPGARKRAPPKQDGGQKKE